MAKYSSLNVVWGKSETNIPKMIYIRQNWLTDDLYDKLENHVKLNESETRKATDMQRIDRKKATENQTQTLIKATGQPNENDIENLTLTLINILKIASADKVAAKVLVDKRVQDSIAGVVGKSDEVVKGIVVNITNDDDDDSSSDSNNVLTSVVLSSVVVPTLAINDDDDGNTMPSPSHSSDRAKRKLSKRKVAIDSVPPPLLIDRAKRVVRLPNKYLEYSK
jgi:hypothetical protein